MKNGVVTDNVETRSCSEDESLQLLSPNKIDNGDIENNFKLVLLCTNNVLSLNLL